MQSKKPAIKPASKQRQEEVKEKLLEWGQHTCSNRFATSMLVGSAEANWFLPESIAQEWAKYADAIKYVSSFREYAVGWEALWKPEYAEELVQVFLDQNPAPQGRKASIVFARSQRKTKPRRTEQGSSQQLPERASLPMIPITSNQSKEPLQEAASNVLPSGRPSRRAATQQCRESHIQSRTTGFRS